ncbi:hypothetical protein M2418_001769 [Rhizobium sp. BIGb0125]|nr:hypothetical protein [Rhizobium sp. BIGb0125]
MLIYQNRCWGIFRLQRVRLILSNPGCFFYFFTFLRNEVLSVVVWEGLSDNRHTVPMSF